MRTVSTGVGLCVLGVCVLGAAALSSPRLGSAAIAAGGAPRSSLPATAIRPEPNPMQRNPMPSNSSLTDCEVRVEHWFSPVPHLLEECAGGWFQFSYARGGTMDLLGDGKPRVLFSADWRTSPPDFNLTTVEFQRLPDGTTSQTRVIILSQDDSELISNFYALGLVSGTFDPNSNGGIGDMDGDSDLDLVISGTTADGQSQRVWFENIRGDAVRQNPYDLDRNGSVNTADLSLLLMEFTD